jgi:hypothetical protein
MIPRDNKMGNGRRVTMKNYGLYLAFGWCLPTDHVFQAYRQQNTMVLFQYIITIYSYLC